MNALLLHSLKEAQNKGRLKFYENHPLSLVSTFGIGGDAGVFVLPQTQDALCSLVSEIDQTLPYKIIGNASNLLFSDNGYNGAIICTKHLDRLSLLDSAKNEQDAQAFELTGQKHLIFSDCGCALSHLCAFALKNGISGFEGLCSIPATIGGAIINNAGAFGCEIADTLVACVIYYPKSRKTVVYPIQSSDFSYRKSKLREEDAVILSAYFSVRLGSPDQILAKMKSNKEKRISAQPTGLRSAGSYFKRPEAHLGYERYRGKSAGELIDICGLKGFSLGNAMISEKHANFIVNPLGQASAQDVLALAKLVKDTVYQKTGIMLCEEIEYVPSP